MISILQNDNFQLIVALGDQTKRNPSSQARLYETFVDSKTKHVNVFSRIADMDDPLIRNIQLMIGYSYFCLGVIERMANSIEANYAFSKSYHHFKNAKHVEFLACVKNELHEIKQLMIDSIDHTHIVYNRVFCLTNDFVPLMTKLPNIDVPQFTYYT